MDCARNIITAFFNGGRTATTAPLYQWDYGQVLCINGLTLPAAFQVHFSNNPISGTTTTSIGQDGQVTIPDVYLTKGLHIYAFIFLHNGEDDGETEYIITIPVNARPRPTDEEPTPEQQAEINQLIDALNNGVERSETAAESAEAAATAAAASATAASGSASDSAASATSAEGSATAAATSAGTASQAATTASGAATTATAKATEATTAATAAQTAQSAAESAQTAAQASEVSAAASAAQAAEDAADISDVKSALGACIITDTASGAIASFPDGADGIPMESVTVAMEPIQDLHGQDAPYPAGGGKNLLPAQIDTVKSINRGGTWSGNVYTQNGVTFTLSTTEDGYVTAVNVNGTATSNAHIRLEQSNDQDVWLLPNTAYIINGTPSGTETTKCRLQINYNQITGAISQPGNDVSFTTPTSITEQECYVIVLSGNTANNLVFKPMIRLASVSDATFAPYSNICPISGRTSVGVTRAGVNVWDEEWELGGIDGTTGENLPNTDRIRSKNYISVYPGTSYYFGYSDSRLATFYVCEYNESKAFIKRTTTDKNTVFTVGSNCRYIRFFIYSSVPITTYDNNISINYPSTDHDYHPGTVASVEVQLGQTVYGGTVDVVTGTMTVDRAMVDMGTLNWGRGNTQDGHWRFTTPLSAIKPSTSGTAVPNMVCSAYATVTPNNTWMGMTGVTSNNGNSMVLACDESYSDAASFKTAVTGQTLVYELAQPITVQLTPEQLTTLLGQNNVWSDADSVTVEYTADTKLYIQKVIAAALA